VPADAHAGDDVDHGRPISIMSLAWPGGGVAGPAGGLHVDDVQRWRRTAHAARLRLLRSGASQYRTVLPRSGSTRGDPLVVPLACCRGHDMSIRSYAAGGFVSAVE
jgi:hypothetical protein